MCVVDGVGRLYLAYIIGGAMSATACSANSHFVFSHQCQQQSVCFLWCRNNKADWDLSERWCVAGWEKIKIMS